MPWREIRLETLADVQSRMHLIASEGDWAHRGQASAEWKDLRPSLARALAPGLSQGDRLNIERQATQTFLQLARHHLDAADSALLGHPLQRNVIMQHFRAPTRLLDWTASPWVALYFAVSSFPDQDGTVWSFRTTDLRIRTMQDQQQVEVGLQNGRAERLLEMFYNEVPMPIVWLLDPWTRNSRLAAQQALFTVASDVGGDHAQLLADFYPTESNDVLCRFVIPKELKRQTVLMLAAMNISPATLFPGLDGLGASIADLVTHQIRSPGLIGRVFLQRQDGSTLSCVPLA
ncbi:MAG: FRG domain-containing protein [Planctomycetota bacterium]